MYSLLTRCFLIFLMVLFILLPDEAYAQIKKRLSTSVHTVAHRRETKKSAQNSEKKPVDEEKIGPAEYPYLTTTFYFRNREKFSDKKFIRKILNVKYFYVEASFAYQTLEKKNIEVKSPLFIVEREGGKYSSSLFEDITLINKVPYNLYGSSIPSVSCYTKQVSKNKLSLISELTSLCKPLAASDPFSSLTGITNFVDDVVKKLAADQTVEVRSSFPTFSVRDIGINPFSYKVLVYHPDTLSYTADELVVVEDSTSYLSVETKVDSMKLTVPYIIIETGLSNYVALGGLPSEVLDEYLICAPTSARIAELKVFVNNHEHVLSPNQLRNEQYLISMLEQVILINEGLIGERDNKTDKIVLAYDAYYDRSNFPLRTGTLFEEHYEKIVRSMFRCYTTSGLTYSSNCEELILQFNNNELNYTSLASLVQQLTVLDSDPNKCMNKTKIYRIAATKRTNYEHQLYMKEFAKPISDLEQKLEPWNASEAKGLYDKLVDKLNEYRQCSKCMSQAQDVTKKYQEKLAKDNGIALEEVTKKQTLETSANDLLKQIDANSAMVQNKVEGNVELNSTNTELNTKVTVLKESLEKVQKLEIPKRNTSERAVYNDAMERLEKAIEDTNKLSVKVNKPL